MTGRFAGDNMAAHFTTLITVAALFVISASAGSAQAPPAPCAQCQPLAERLKALQERLPVAEAELKQASESLRALKLIQVQEQAEAEVRRGFPPSPENQARLQSLEASIRGRAPAITALERRVIQLEVEVSDLDSSIRFAAEDLGRCKRGCGSAAQPPGPTGVTPGTTTTPAGTPESPALVPACEECKALVDELEGIEKRQRDARDRIESAGDAIDDLRRELRELDQIREQLNTMKASGDPAVKLSDAEYARRLKEVESRIQRIEDVEIGNHREDRQEARDELEELDGELQKWWPRWNECNRRCNPKGPKWFSRPLFWISLAGAGVLGATAVGGGDGSSPTTPNSPAPPVVTPPPAQTQPLGSSISGTYSLAGNPQSQNCRVGVLPVFLSFTGGLVLQIGSDNTGTAITRHANGWVFTHQVEATPNEGGFRVRSIMPHPNSQPFGGLWEASIDIQVTGQLAFTGVETHARREGGPACQDIYTIQGPRQ